MPSQVWASDAGPRRYWNVLCAIDGEQPWARYTTEDPSLMEWRLADRQFTRPIALGCYDCTENGIMFRPIPNPAKGGKQKKKAVK